MRGSTDPARSTRHGVASALSPASPRRNLRAVIPATPAPDPDAPWTADDSAELYRVPAWSQGYFEVGDDGRLSVRPRAADGPEIDLPGVVEGLRERGVEPPFLVRYSDILVHHLRTLRYAFDAPIEGNGYGDDYAPVYPVEVNQERSVAEEIYR